jgi:superfamily I DNA/RNA helicase
MARDAFKWAISPHCREFDFADQLYLPIAWNMDFSIHKYDNVVIDEVQDMSILKHLFISQMVNVGGHVLGVGDPYQAIYGFAGADSSSMTKFRETFRCRELPLSITYRNPKLVVAEAQKYVPHIRAADDAKDGIVDLNHPEVDELSLTPNDMILCRNNAPLFTIALRLLRERRPFNLVGEFGDRLRKFISSFKTNDIRIFETRLKEWFEKESNTARDKERWTKLAQLEDRYSAVAAIYPGHSTVEAVIETLDKLLMPGIGPRLSSIHRAKGLEADRVFIIEAQLIPSKYAKLDWMKEQERNLLYVAYTRARRELYAIRGIVGVDEINEE